MAIINKYFKDKKFKLEHKCQEIKFKNKAQASGNLGRFH